MRLSRAFASLLVALGVASLDATHARAQAGGATECELNQEGRPTTRVNYVRRESGAEDAFVGGGAVVRCPARGITLSSDSAEYYGDRRVWYLIGSVRYREPRLTLDSQRATYWMAEERLLAEGNVVTRLPSGTTMRGPQMEYFRAVPGLRELARMIAPGRPRFELVQLDSTGAPAEPVRLVADRVVMDGDSLVYASGDVEITRPDVLATGDSATIDSGREWARLMRGPVIQGLGEQPFTLRGSVIDLFSEQRSLQRVLAAGEGAILSEDLDLRADTIDLRLADDRLQRAYAFGPSRARAVSEASDILADSLDVHLPNQRLTEVRAIGGAFAQSMPDTSRLRTEERDWLRGDSIIATFDTTAAPRVARATRPTDVQPGATADSVARLDSARTSELRELLAVGRATSFYQIAPEDSTELRPTVNLVTGRQIAVFFGEGVVRDVRVLGQTHGVLLQPEAPGTENAAPTAPPGGAAPAPPTGAGQRPPDGSATTGIPPAKATGAPPDGVAAPPPAGLGGRT